MLVSDHRIAIYYHVYYVSDPMLRADINLLSPQIKRVYRHYCAHLAIDELRQEDVYLGNMQKIPWPKANSYVQSYTLITLS